jgi:dynein heavy chain
MNHCSPATVSRGGVIYVNAEDVGWRPMVDSWIEHLEAAEYRPLLTALFTRYVDTTLEHCRRNFKTLVPLPAVNQVMTVCKILEGILPKVRVTHKNDDHDDGGGGGKRMHSVGGYHGEVWATMLEFG